MAPEFTIKIDYPERGAVVSSEEPVPFDLEELEAQLSGGGVAAESAALPEPSFDVEQAALEPGDLPVPDLGALGVDDQVTAPVPADLGGIEAALPDTAAPIPQDLATFGAAALAPDESFPVPEDLDKLNRPARKKKTVKKSVTKAGKKTKASK